MSYALFLCDRSGIMARPWLEAGVRCVTVDLQPAAYKHPLRYHVMEDVRRVAHLMAVGFMSPCNDLAGPCVFVAAFPPCTDLAASGTRWRKGKGLRPVIEALEIAHACLEIAEASGAPYMLENPVGLLSTVWGKPDHYFHPVHYAGYAEDPEADSYTKKTGIWCGGGFKMPPRKLASPDLGLLDKIHKAPDSYGRADKRAQTPVGFANACFRSNFYGAARLAARQAQHESAQKTEGPLL